MRILSLFLLLLSLGCTTTPDANSNTPRPSAEMARPGRTQPGDPFAGLEEMVVAGSSSTLAIDSASLANYTPNLAIASADPSTPADPAATPVHHEVIYTADLRVVVVSIDQVTDLGALQIVTSVNGEERQNASAAGLVFDVPMLIGYLSQITTLVPGDLIFTGTPAGVGPVVAGDQLHGRVAGLSDLRIAISPAA